MISARIHRKGLRPGHRPGGALFGFRIWGVPPAFRAPKAPSPPKAKKAPKRLEKSRFICYNKGRTAISPRKELSHAIP